MKHAIPILAPAALILSILQLQLITPTLYAAVPLRWTVDVSRVQPAVFDVVRGETIALEATLKNDGKPFETGPEPVCIFWQTNGMGRLWWSAPAQVLQSPTPTPNSNSISNILSAVFTPAMDPGAATVNGFLGSTGDIYRAAFQLRFRHGPGAVPNVIEQPPPVLDLAHTVVINPPWPTDQTIDARIRQVIADDDITANVPTGMVRTVVSNTVNKAYVESLGISGGGSSIDTNAVIDIAQSVVAPAVNAAVRTASALAGGVATSATNYTDTVAASKADADDLDDYLPLSGGTMRGDINLDYYDIIDVLNLSAFGLTIYESAAFEADASVSGDLTVGNILTVGNAIDLGGTGDIIDANSVSASNIYAYDDVTYDGNKSLKDLDAVVEGKATKVRDATAGNLASLTSSGNLSDSGVSASSLTSLSSQVSGLASSKADSADVTQLGSDVSQLNLQVAALGATANAEDARFVSTNYNSSTRMPEAYVDVKVSNSWITVWREMTRWNWFLSGYANYTNDIASALANKGEREWGWFDSATGNPSPDGILQLSQPSILICSGAAYQRYATASGAAWVLESNGLVSDINGTTNGFFRISDEEGNAHFEIVKGDKQTLFATARTMTQQQMGVTHYFTTYAVTNAVAQPTAEFTRSLNPVAWIREGEQGFPCNVRWTNNGNNSYTVEWWPIGDEPQMFMRCGYERGGETYIRNNAPVSMDYIYLGGVKYRLGTATVSGHTVLTLTQE